ncbi:hypothetical protein PSQ40_10780 [Curvibacter sp. HBC61]|uniref:Uncharacterized protein n=1 Tax=Curvibacter cyanobacteriorum TaxID=3026422 RepID=A0ABT5MZ00_9BURK|nr:hypothetical protein [Curvibacter sp. HBC61]MDD0839057.1 hypothetical protein [Curvibacter sp. HBC61]
MQLPPVDRTMSWAAYGAGASASAGESERQTPTKPATTVTNAPTESTIITVSGRKVESPDKPSASNDQPNKDWTEVKKKATTEEPKKPPPEPISKKLLDFIHSVWKASGSVVELAATEASAEANRLQNEQTKAGLSTNLLVYTDPKVKRGGGL